MFLSMCQKVLFEIVGDNMTDNKVNIKINLSGVIRAMTTSILFGCIGYFVYGGFEGFLATFITAFIVIGFICICSIIPIIGWIGSSIITYFWLIPKIFDLTGIHWTWLITIIFSFAVLIGLMVTITFLIIVLWVLYT